MIVKIVTAEFYNNVWLSIIIIAMLFMHRGAFKSPKEIIETKSGMEQTKEIVDECNDSFM